MANWTGIEVKREMTSNETITSSTAIICVETNLANSFEFFTVQTFSCLSDPISLAGNLEVVYVGEPMQLFIGLIEMLLASSASSKWSTFGVKEPLWIFERL